MKNTTKLLNLLTAFLAVMGICAASLVCFIVAYTQINGGFSPQRTTDQKIIVAQTDNNVIGTFSFSTDSNDNSTSEPLSDTDTLNNYNDIEPISLVENQASNDIYEQPTFEYDINPTTAETDYAINIETTATSDLVTYATPIEQETSITPSTEQSDSNFIYSYEVPIENSAQIANSSIATENGNNFNTYNTPEQHQTIDTYVLNTNPDRMKIHYPTCRDVEKISPENYSTSSLSISDLYAQGYTTCGHCFR